MTEHILKIAAVGLGGATGSILRYLLGLLPNPFLLPVWTLVVNILGAVSIGFIIGHQKSTNPIVYVGLKTGFCGGFTTFSTFSQETLSLLEGGHAVYAALYALASLISCLLGVYLGHRLATSCGA